MQRNQPDNAELWFHKAQELKLPSDNERAMILIQMINIHLTKIDSPRQIIPIVN